MAVEVTGEPRPAPERVFVLVFALGCAILATLPSLFAILTAPEGALYLGTQWATDDHMVYAAWTRQAMDGAFLFDNRFTTDSQPGLTIHLYFWAVGQLARFTGVTLALLLAKAVLSFAFVIVAHRFIKRLTTDPGSVKACLALVVFGGGVGYLVWQKFGLEISLSRPKFVTDAMLGRLPTDTWQPEGFVFPSMLTTGLFLAALCLILTIFSAFLDAKDSWKPVAKGALAMLVLMNIHSYDVLLVALVMGAFLVMSLAQRQVTVAWLFRSLTIAAGAIPAALWFLYVLQNDPVFQSRAGTPTYAPNFRQFVFGYFVLLILGLAALLPAADRKGKAGIGTALLGGLFIGLFAGAGSHLDGYWMLTPVWIGLYAAFLAVLWMLARSDSAFNLVAAWASIGLIAPYFPGLFQRKLAMGLVVPWAILAGLFLGGLLLRRIPRQRALLGALAILVCCGSSALWLQRELQFVRNDVARTTIHPIFLSPGDAKLLATLEREKGRKVVLAKPGQWNPLLDSSFAPIPDSFGSPIFPDLNPIASGLTGAYTYAGHWSETPDYQRKREALSLFFSDSIDDAQRSEFARSVGATHVIVPKPPEGPDLINLGDVIERGSRFDLVRIRR